MKAPLGTVVIENKGGGGGVIGATEVARATPDGHTLLFGNTSTQVLIPAIAEKPPYDPVQGFPGGLSSCAIRRPRSWCTSRCRRRTLKEFIAYAKANPTKLSYGSAGAGTMTHLAGELFKQLIGVPGHHPHSLQRRGARHRRSRLRPHPDDDAERRRAAAAAPPTGKVRILAVNAEQRLEGGAGHSDRDRARRAGHDRRSCSSGSCAPAGDAEADRRRRFADATQDGAERSGVPEGADRLRASSRSSISARPRPRATWRRSIDALDAGGRERSG